MDYMLQGIIYWYCVFSCKDLMMSIWSFFFLQRNYNEHLVISMYSVELCNPSLVQVVIADDVNHHARQWEFPYIPLLILSFSMH